MGLGDTLDERAAQLAEHFAVALPSGQGPFPVVVMLHGCGGVRPFMNEVAEAAVKAGAASIIVDSFAPRRISRVAAFATVCTGLQLRGGERAGDLYAALHWAREQPWADPQRLVAAGWSHGGWTVLDALALAPGPEMARFTGIAHLPAEPLTGLVGAFLVYPYAGIASLVGRRAWRLAPRAVAILAGRDHVVGVGTPRAALERQRRRGAPLEIVTFDTVTHAFEDAVAEDLRVRYDPAAAARERRMLAELVASVSAPPPPAR